MNITITDIIMQKACGVDASVEFPFVSFNW